jgi:hypothetical protein
MRSVIGEEVYRFLAFHLFPDILLVESHLEGNNKMIF